jgi:glutaredoxin-related protein
MTALEIANNSETTITMIDKERIKKEAEAFFEWPTSDRRYVTTASALLFTEIIAGMVEAETRRRVGRQNKG